MLQRIDFRAPCGIRETRPRVSVISRTGRPLTVGHWIESRDRPRHRPPPEGCCACVHYWAAPSGSRCLLPTRRSAAGLCAAEPFARCGVRKYSLKQWALDRGRMDARRGRSARSRRATGPHGWWPGRHLPRRPSSMSPLRRRPRRRCLPRPDQGRGERLHRSAALVVPEGPGLALARLWIRADDGRAAERDGDRVRPCGDLAPLAEIAIWRADRPHH